MTCCGCAAGGAGASMSAIRVAEWNPLPGSTTAPLADGVQAPTAAGTATIRAINNNTLGESARRIGYVSAAAINSVAGVHANVANLTTGRGVAPLPTGRFPFDGFKALFQWSISDAVLNGEARMFVGLTGSVAGSTAVDPTTVANMVGFGCDTGETTLHAYARDNVGNIIDLDLGVNFPVNAPAGGLATSMGNLSFWRALIECPAGQVAGAFEFRWRVESMFNGFRANGTHVLNAWTIGQTLTPRLWRSTGPANAAAVGIDLHMMRLQTPY